MKDVLATLNSRDQTLGIRDIPLNDLGANVF
jgi:hypothetical protein